MATKYTVKEAVKVELNHPMFGRIAKSFDAGARTPKSEEEEIVLNLLVDQGLAEITKGK